RAPARRRRREAPRVYSGRAPPCQPGFTFLPDAPRVFRDCPSGDAAHDERADEPGQEDRGALPPADQALVARVVRPQRAHVAGEDVVLPLRRRRLRPPLLLEAEGAAVGAAAA